MQQVRDSVEYSVRANGWIAPIRVISRDCIHPYKEHCGWSSEPYTPHTEPFKNDWYFDYQFFDCEICGVIYEKLRAIEFNDERYFVNLTDNLGKIVNAKSDPSSYEKSRRIALQMQVSSHLWNLISPSPNESGWHTHAEIREK